MMHANRSRDFTLDPVDDFFPQIMFPPPPKYSESANDVVNYKQCGLHWERSINVFVSPKKYILFIEMGWGQPRRPCSSAYPVETAWTVFFSSTTHSRWLETTGSRRRTIPSWEAIPIWKTSPSRLTNKWSMHGSSQQTTVRMMMTTIIDKMMMTLMTTMMTTMTTDDDDDVDDDDDANSLVRIGIMAMHAMLCCYVMLCYAMLCWPIMNPAGRLVSGSSPSWVSIYILKKIMMLDHGTWLFQVLSNGRNPCSYLDCPWLMHVSIPLGLVYLGAVRRHGLNNYDMVYRLVVDYYCCSLIETSGHAWCMKSYH